MGFDGAPACRYCLIRQRWCSIFVRSFGSRETSKIRLKTLSARTHTLKYTHRETADCQEKEHATNAELPTPPLHMQFTAQTSAKVLEPHNHKKCNYFSFFLVFGVLVGRLNVACSRLAESGVNAPATKWIGDGVHLNVPCEHILNENKMFRVQNR